MVSDDYIAIDLSIALVLYKHLVNDNNGKTFDSTHQRLFQIASNCRYQARLNKLF